MSPQQAIATIRKEMGESLGIIGHHYQIDDVIRHTDHRGDSLALARMVNALPARHIVFCGVFFMAESAALLARPDQSVYLPVPTSECEMALMSPPDQVSAVLARLAALGRHCIPVTYVNSSLAVKAAVGAGGGTVCTSANARQVLAWALSRGDSVLFVPDRNLGANTARDLGMAEAQIHYLKDRQAPHLLEPFAPEAFSVDALDLDSPAASSARVFLWPGYCPIHEKFTLDHVRSMRKAHPAARIAVHPECSPGVVQAVDGAGSTTYCIKAVQEAAPGSTTVVGTELNLVKRLQQEYHGQKTVLPLAESECSYMMETTEQSLLDCLTDIKSGGTRYRAVANPHLAAQARLALETMLEICQ